MSGGVQVLVVGFDVGEGLPECSNIIYLLRQEAIEKQKRRTKPVMFGELFHFLPVLSSARFFSLIS